MSFWEDSSSERRTQAVEEGQLGQSEWEGGVFDPEPRASLMAQMVESLPAMSETWV